MPNFDKTGPLGYGKMTGGGFGPCGCGVRRGYGRRFMTKSEEKEVLQEEAIELEKEMSAIKERISELEDQK